MFRLIEQVFITLLSFGGSLITTYLSLNDEPRMIRPTFIDLKPIELNYYLFRISLNVMDVVMLLTTYLRNYTFPVKKDTNASPNHPGFV